MLDVLEKEPPYVSPSEFHRNQLWTPAELLYVRQSSAGDDPADTRLIVILDKTPFYVEAGGQTGDEGRIAGQDFELTVKNMYQFRDWHVHECIVTKGTSADVKAGSRVMAKVNAERRWDIMRNHTATHLAHAALRKVLGDHVKQSGSYVGPDRLRFDFSHHQPMTPDEIAKVEQIVNEHILNGTDVATKEMPVDEAKKAGATALFGEKYGDTVRVVSVADFSMELCGGTHVTNTAQIGPFFITVETGIASGVRRMEAITGREAHTKMFEQKSFVSEVSRVVNRPESCRARVNRLAQSQRSETCIYGPMTLVKPTLTRWLLGRIVTRLQKTLSLLWPLVWSMKRSQLCSLPVQLRSRCSPFTWGISPVSF